MKGQELAEALQSGRRVYGTLIVSASPHWPLVVKDLGLDFVFIDTEHIPIGRDTLSWMCRTYGALGLPPVVRIPEPDPYQACMVLDGGASGVIAPYVETAQQVRQLQGAVKLRPLKGRRMAEILEGKSTLELALAQHLAEVNDDNVLIVNIESRPAIAALDEILAVPGLDAVLIGPHDLSVSLGIPEQYDNPKFDEAVRTVISKARGPALGRGYTTRANSRRRLPGRRPAQTSSSTAATSPASLWPCAQTSNASARRWGTRSEVIGPLLRLHVVTAAAQFFLLAERRVAAPPNAPVRRLDAFRANERWAERPEAEFRDSPHGPVD